MAAYTKYLISFINDLNQLVEIRIKSAQVIATPTAIMAAANPLNISFNGEDDSIFQSVITSKATISVILPESASDFYEDMASMQEDQFGVQINIASFYEWHGWLIPDEQTKTFSYTNETLTITAIDPLSRMKGVKFQNADGTFIYGRHTLKDIVSKCLDQAFNPNNTTGTYTYFVASRLKLSYDTTYPFPDILEQLQVSTEVFNDDMGRPISAFDVIKAIANSLTMRCWYEDRKIYFQDVHVFTTNWALGAKNLSFSDIGATDNILLGNSENVSTIRTFKEASTRYEYKGIVGLLRDGYFQDWYPDGSNFRLTNWNNNSYLDSTYAFTSRRIGNGRQEAPYGIYLTGAPFGASYDEIGNRTEMQIQRGDTLTLAIEAVLMLPFSIAPTENGGDQYKISLWCSVVWYNEFDPTDSRAYNQYYQRWDQYDLTGTTFATGTYDFGAFPGSLPPYSYVELQRTADDQNVSIDLTPLEHNPGNGFGRVFVSISCARASEWAFVSYRNHPITLYSAILSIVPPKLRSRLTKGEVCYVSRKINTSLLKQERTIELNTTVTRGVNGALFTTISYTRTSDGVVVDAGPVSALSNGSFLIDRPLLQYNTLVQMAYNYNQYKVDLIAQCRLLEFNNFISLIDVSDPLRPSTAIYEAPFMQTKHDWNIKRGTRSITVVSMRLNQRTVSTTLLDETHDLVENYYIN